MSRGGTRAVLLVCCCCGECERESERARERESERARAAALGLESETHLGGVDATAQDRDACRVTGEGSKAEGDCDLSGIEGLALIKGKRSKLTDVGQFAKLRSAYD